MAASIIEQLAELRKLDLKELREKYQAVFGKRTQSRNRKQLFSQIARKIQADRAGQKGDGPIKPTLEAKFTPKRKAKAGGKKKKPAAKKTTRAIGQRDSRLPKVGATITREWHGKKYLVRVLDRGFEYEGQPYRSLSGLAKKITSQIINGYLFFGLLDKGSKKH